MHSSSRALLFCGGFYVDAEPNKRFFLGNPAIVNSTKTNEARALPHLRYPFTSRTSPAEPPACPRNAVRSPEGPSATIALFARTCPALALSVEVAVPGWPAGKTESKHAALA